MLRRILPLAKVSREKRPFDTGKLQNYSVKSLNREGILADILKIFNGNHVELTHIESELHNVNKNGKQRADFNLSSEHLQGYIKETIRGQLQ